MKNIVMNAKGLIIFNIYVIYKVYLFLFILSHKYNNAAFIIIYNVWKQQHIYLWTQAFYLEFSH